MSGAVALRRAPPADEAPSLFDEETGSEPTLEEMLFAVWERLAAHESAACPVCGAEAMEPEDGAQPETIRGRCTACRSILT